MCSSHSMPFTWCRVCGPQSHLSEQLSLGKLFVSQFPTSRFGWLLEHDAGSTGRTDPRGPRIPLTIATCNQCGLAQLTHTTDRDLLYHRYWYRSSTNPSMVNQLANIVRTARNLVRVEATDHVLDIGANDGTLLKLWADDKTAPTPRRIGVDPAQNLSGALRQHAEMIISDYWPVRNYAGPLCKVITSIAMFYDLDSPRAFAREVARVLHPEGVWCLQLTDLVSMMRANAFDNICHEHLEYYRLVDIERILRYAGLAIERLEWNDTNGGSIRVWAKHAGQQSICAREQVDEALRSEQEALEAMGGWLGFAARVEGTRRALDAYLSGPEDLALYGASTKGNTLLQYFNLPKQPRFAVERAEEKFGLHTVTGVPIVPEGWGRRNAFAGTKILVLPWHFRQGIIAREHGLWPPGTELVFPLPMLEVTHVGRPE